MRHLGDDPLLVHPHVDERVGRIRRNATHGDHHQVVHQLLFAQAELLGHVGEPNLPTLENPRQHDEQALDSLTRTARAATLTANLHDFASTISRSAAMT